MGKFDKDRAQKELAIRYCLAQRMVPCIEVLVSSASDLSDTLEVLTDLDVVGLEFTADGGFRRLLFDCKTTAKMSPINRAFWASGVLSYTGCDEAFVLLKNKAVFNHRLSALQINVDLHDEQSFIALGETRDLAFSADNYYQSSIDRWNLIHECYEKSDWSGALYGIVRHSTPLTKHPWKVFRKLIAECRNVRGQFDPSKPSHLAMFFDILASLFILWSTMGRDIRRVYDPKMTKPQFEQALRYYIWGGKESYQVRQELRQRAEGMSNGQEFPAWEKLTHLAGLIIAAPQGTFGCVSVCRELSIRTLTGVLAEPERRLAKAISDNKRVRQFVLAATDYLVAACGIPREMSERVQSELNRT